MDLYFLTPNAAAVARELGVSERNVRRVVDRFAPLLERRRAERDRENTARADARRAQLQEWADRAQGENLDVLDELIKSSDEAMRLRAAAARQKLIDGLPTAPFVASGLDAALVMKEFEIVDMLHHADATDDRERLGGLADD